MTPEEIYNPRFTRRRFAKACHLVVLGFSLMFASRASAEQPGHPPLSQSEESGLAQIRTYLDTNRVSKALQTAAELSGKNESDVPFHLALATLLMQKQQLKPAQLEFEKADALQPNDFEVQEGLGRVLLAEQSLGQAELFAQRALKLQPASADALYLLAQIYTGTSRPLDALDLLARARKIDPQNVDILLFMARISMSQKYFEDAIPLLEQGLELAPGRNDLRAALGESYFKSDKIDKCIAIFNKVVETEPTVRAYSYLGLAYTYLGRFNEAREQFQKGLNLDPRDVFSLFHLGYVAERQGDLALAQSQFEKVLGSDPKFPYALLELANLQMQKKQFSGAEKLLKRYIEVAPDSATGYYKLAMTERALHDQDGAARDLARFQALSKQDSAASHPYEHLFDYVDTRSKLDPNARNQMVLAELIERIKSHPDEPQTLYLLAQAYLKAGKANEARSTIAHLDQVASADARTLTGAGVLLARYRLLDDAIRNFKAALQVAPDSNDIAFDLADAYFRKGLYSEALAAALQVSDEGRKDDAYLALSGDIYAHLGNLAQAAAIFHDAIDRNPDNDQNYLSLSLIHFRRNKIEEAERVLDAGQTRLPGSGKILWGRGLAAALIGDTTKAAECFEQAVNLLPEWPGSYSALGIFYYQTGQVIKAREVLDRFRNSNANGALDINRIEQALAQAPAGASAAPLAMTAEQSRQFLQVALYLVDKTL